MLDVTIQAQILELVRARRKTREMSILFITHDLGVIAELCDRVDRDVRGPRRGRGADGRAVPKPQASVHRGAA